MMWRWGTILLVLCGCSRHSGNPLVDDEPLRDQLKSESEGYLAAGRWEELDALCDRTWAGRERLPSGGWKLSILMNAMADPLDGKSDISWQSRLDQLSRWRTARPSSVAALTALGLYWNGYGGFARGTGYGDTVTPEGARLYAERLGKAREALELAAALPGVTAEVFSAQLCVGIGEGWDRAKMDRTVAAGLALEPDYHLLHTMMVRYLLPRWHGESATDWEEYARSVADSGGRPDWYARMVVAEMRVGDMADDFREQVPWRRLRRGFDEWDRRYPDSRLVWTARAYFATILREAEEAEAAFIRLEGRPDPVLWDNPKSYASGEAWARKRSDWERRYGWRHLILTSGLPALAGIGVLVWLIRLRRRNAVV